MNSIIAEIEQLKQEKKAAILAHYYVNDEVQSIADYIGDSFYLSKVARDIPEQTIVFCGVSFMGESAKIMNPDKTILMPDTLADCPMAHMADPERIKALKAEYPDLAVVCYINSTAELKKYSDVCVTSSNALKIVKALPNNDIFFIPDENLGRYIAKQLPEKHFLFNDGFCHVHKSISKEALLKAKEAQPEAQILAHPECTGDVLELADYIGSTSGIIDYATATDCEKFIICTEMGVLHELQEKNPNKKFYSVGHRQFCPNMKKITLEKVRDALLNNEPAVTVDATLAADAIAPLSRMMQMG